MAKRMKKSRKSKKSKMVRVGKKHCLKFGSTRYCCHKTSVRAFGRKKKVGRVFCRKVSKKAA